MEMQDVIDKSIAIRQRAAEFIRANAPELLPDKRCKLIDLCVVSLMSFEDDVFTWVRLRNAAMEALLLHEYGPIPWYIDFHHSTLNVLVISNEKTHQCISMDVARLVLLSGNECGVFHG